MGYLHHVFLWIWLLFYSWTCLFPHSLGNSIHSCSSPHDRPPIPSSLTSCKSTYLLYTQKLFLNTLQWLAKVGRKEEAIKTLADIQARGNIHDPLVVAEWEEIWTVLAAERESPPGWRKFVYRGMWRRTAAGMSVQ